MGWVCRLLLGGGRWLPLLVNWVVDSWKDVCVDFECGCELLETCSSIQVCEYKFFTCVVGVAVVSCIFHLAENNVSLSEELF